MIKKILRFRGVSIMSLGSVALSLGGACWAIISFARLGTGPFIVHFNDMTGITSGGIDLVVCMGILGSVITVMNFFITIELEERDPFLGKLMAGGTLIFAVLLFISFAAIINVNV